MTERDSEMLTRAEARLGTVLRGKYRLDRVLGIGGMAVVYKATHRNQAEFAVKMLHAELSISASVRSRFLREGYAANSVKHPGAVLVVDDDVGEDGAAFLVMELLDGVPCDELWERSGRRLPSHVASAIVVQLLDVLAAAHAKEIVHRDIKPANLFLTRTGVVKVLDFGIARAREAMTAGAHATGTGAMLGTPAYMAPEQARGRTRDIDSRTDLWAAGATFFAFVSGELVHQAETVHELMIAAATQMPRSVAAVAPGVPPAVAAVIDRALAFNKEDRWQTAGEMRAALLQVNRAQFGAATPEAVAASALQSQGGMSVPPSGTAPTVETGPGSRSSPPSEQVPSARSLTGAANTKTPVSMIPGLRPARARWAVPAGVVVAGALAAGVWAASGSHWRGAAGVGGTDAGVGAATQHQQAGSVERGDSAVPASALAPDAQATTPTVSIHDLRVTPAPTPRAAPRPPPVPTRPATPKPNCDPNWYMESGIKKYKPECPLN